MKKILFSIVIILFFIGSGFSFSYEKMNTQVKIKSNSATEILTKKEIPILCYHNIKEFKSEASKIIKAYTVKPKAFAEQMKNLSDNGFHTILPDQLYDYLLYNKPLPTKPILITFDDTREEQYRLAATEMKKYGFKGVFFIMTVSINRPGYMSKEQIKNLSDSGNVIASHTWDHHMVTKYNAADWNTQLIKPQKQLEGLTGKKVRYFAYPFGVWNTTAITELRKQDYKLAFILSTKRDDTQPLFTIRRLIVAGTWSTPQMLKNIGSTFN